MRNRYSKKFVGRKTLIKKACAALSKGGHIFVHGPFGIGKTSFALAVLQNLKLPPFKISLENPAHEMGESLLKQLIVFEYEQARSNGKHLRGTSKVETTCTYMNMNALKRRLKEKAMFCKILILDDIFTVSHQKIKFLRFLQTLGFRFISVIETTKYPKDLFLLRSICLPHAQLTVPRLNSSESEELIKLLNEKLSKKLSAIELDSILPHLNGYPLMIVERMMK